MDKKHIGFDVPWPNLRQVWAFARKWLLPNPGTLALMAVLVLATPSLAAIQSAPKATSTSTISYQGRLADSAGNPLTGYYNLEFRIYDDPSTGTPLWEEFWTGSNSVQVSDGLFHVMLGSIDNTLAAAIEGYNELYLGITVGTDSEMVPRVQLGSVPFAMYAAQASVPDGSITTTKLADGAVTQPKLAPGAVSKVSILRQNDTTNDLDDRVILTGWGYIQGNDTQGIGEMVNFGLTFAEQPVVLLDSLGGCGSTPPTQIGDCNGGNPADPKVLTALAGNSTTSGFEATLVRTDCCFNSTLYYGYSWIAIGTAP